MFSNSVFVILIFFKIFRHFFDRLFLLLFWTKNGRFFACSATFQKVFMLPSNFYEQPIFFSILARIGILHVNVVGKTFMIPRCSVKMTEFFPKKNKLWSSWIIFMFFNEQNQLQFPEKLSLVNVINGSRKQKLDKVMLNRRLKLIPLLKWET